MLMKILLMINLINFTFFIMSNPLTISINIFSQTILIALTMGLMMNSFWFSYILFMILVGGLMIILIYMCSISANNLFMMKFNLLILFTIMVLIINITPSLTNNMTSPNWISNFNKYMTLNNQMMNLNNNSIKLNKLFNNKSFMITLLVINLLFILMIISSKMTYWIKGPLRKMN
uniref:NADH dehydrogenase subunit 6 n=1 Tax=Pseudoneureclipsis sibuyana TaxID=2904893 RepID=A0A9E8LP91_9NEOP|nr:NADH dehydrogenase subunit 6 [Pseudoneureclipsis sibuyana]UZZ44293.1 NADH dehydrogenase subunit 6 [Pseudoneureclipsis sibuyana]